MWRAWARMKRRCQNTSDISYRKWYGPKGIKVCKRWQLFENFYEDMGDPPSGTTLDRIRSNEGYHPGNCRWATQKQQQRNRTNNALIEFRGETRPMAEWAEIVGIPNATLWARLRVLKWTVEKSLTVPVRGK